VAWRKTVAGLTIGRITDFLCSRTDPDPIQEIRRLWDIRDAMQFDDEKSLGQAVLNRAPAISTDSREAGECPLKPSLAARQPGRSQCDLGHEMIWHAKKAIGVRDRQTVMSFPELSCRLSLLVAPEM
jgi:hypothetical protein